MELTNCALQIADNMDTAVKRGVYRHFKGRYYLVLGEAVHSETNETMVVYQPLYGESRWFVRPRAMFLETVERDGARIARFEYAGDTLPL